MMDPTPPMLVLVVDDDPVNLKVLSEALSGQPFSMAVATDGAMALEQIGRERPDLILLDAVMPEIDGFEVCRRLKADPATESIPVIFMTALAEAASRIRGLRLGAVDYVTKPFEREELLARIHTQIALQAAMKALSDKNAELEREVLERAEAQATLAATVQQLEQARAEIAQAAEERAAHQQRIIAAQASRLTELSTPIIPISDRVLVMPLVGILDEERAGRVLEAALERTVQSQAEVMILDITGVPHADERVAAAIIDTARALRLLGAHTVLTGIRPDVAQTLVALEVDFTEIVTESTLQAGIAYAMRRRSQRRQGKPEAQR